MLYNYEHKHWTDVDSVTDAQVKQSEIAKQIAEKETIIFLGYKRGYLTTKLFSFSYRYIIIELRDSIIVYQRFLVFCAF